MLFSPALSPNGRFKLGQEIGPEVGGLSQPEWSQLIFTLRCKDVVALELNFYSYFVVLEWRQGVLGTNQVHSLLISYRYLFASHRFHKTCNMGLL